MSLINKHGKEIMQINKRVKTYRDIDRLRADVNALSRKK